MKLNLVRGGICAALLLMCHHGRSATFSEARPVKDSSSAAWKTVDVFQTNTVARVVTNVIEVRAPQNIFVNEYRTNWFQRTVTNFINVPVTNVLTRTRTNMVPVNLVRTNVVDQYQTNWLAKTLTNVVPVTLVRTNVVDRLYTNITTLTVTNRVDDFRTNWITRTTTNHVERYRTNWVTVTLTNSATLNLTNWETVVVTRTNWIPQPLTNFVDANVPFATAVLVPEQAPKPAPKVEAPAVEAGPDSLVVETLRTGRPFDNNGVEMRFKVRLSSDAAAVLPVAQWRVERDDGAVLFSAQTQEFSRSLPPGRYTIQVKAQRHASAPLLAARSVVDVTRDAVARR